MRDECFIRGKVPMTKSEVRAISLSKMGLMPDSIVYDIGAGTGSVAVEAALKVFRGHVYAVEQGAEGCNLIRQNREHFGVTNLTVIAGKAPACLVELPVPDCAFIGGSGGNLMEILELLLHKNPRITMVINCITLETMNQIMVWLTGRDLDAEVVQVQISRAERRGGYHMMKAQNPVFVITIEPEQVQKK